MTEKGIFLSVKVVPKASRSEIVGLEGEVLKVRVAAPPEKGEANLELIRFLAKELKIPKSVISIIQGETSRHKKVLIERVDKAVLDRLSSLSI